MLLEANKANEGAELGNAKRKPLPKLGRGISQLTVVETALCPLSSELSLVENLSHEASFRFGPSRKRQTSQVRIHCPEGLLAQDELYLWGLLALTLRDPNHGCQLRATRHFILKQLGLIDAGSRHGGRQYARLTSAIQRLSVVSYTSSQFYDPIRAEYHLRTFRFFSYTAPTNVDSGRAWRFVWDPLFIEMLEATGGKLRFDLGVYKELDPASRRLYLFLAKQFNRKKSRVVQVDIDDVAVNVIGYSKTLERKSLNQKLRKCLQRLFDFQVIAELPFADGNHGSNRVVLKRGKLFNRRIDSRLESPVVPQLQEIGFDSGSIEYILQKFPSRMVSEWADITLAAKERFGMQFFKKSPAAYCRDNLNRTLKNNSSPPDWWLDIRKAEERARADRAKQYKDATRSPNQLPQKAMDSLDDVHQVIFESFLAAGQSESQARANVTRISRTKTQGTK